MAANLTTRASAPRVAPVPALEVVPHSCRPHRASNRPTTSTEVQRSTWYLTTIRQPYSKISIKWTLWKMTIAKTDSWEISEALINVKITTLRARLRSVSTNSNTSINKTMKYQGHQISLVEAARQTVTWCWAIKSLPAPSLRSLAATIMTLIRIQYSLGVRMASKTKTMLKKKEYTKTT